MILNYLLRELNHSISDLNQTSQIKRKRQLKSENLIVRLSVGPNRRFQFTFHKCRQCAVCRSSDFLYRFLQSEKYQSAEDATNQPFADLNLGIQNRQVSTRSCHSLQLVGIFKLVAIPTIFRRI